MNSKMIYIIIAVVVVLGVIFAVWHSHSKKASNQTSQQSSNQTASVLDADGCPQGKDVNSVDANGRFKPTLDISNRVAVLDTSMGKISIDLYDKDAPKTVENFVCLIKKGYYNNLTFHRVAKGFVIQGGDPNGDGSGGTSIYGGPFTDELYADTPSYKAGYLKGVVAMANAGPNTNGSQFFIMLADQPLPNAYTIFGKVSAGQDAVDKIGAVPITPVLGPTDGTPKTKVLIKTATIINKQ